jgi:hypothetical protein
VKVLGVFNVATPDINKHAHMLQEILYFKEAIHDDSHWNYKKLNPIVMVAAIVFTDKYLGSLLRNGIWHNYKAVFNKHEVFQLINTIVRRHNVLSNMDHTLYSTEDDNEDDIGRAWDKWLLEQRDICREY